jgi:hypothetical protein
MKLEELISKAEEKKAFAYEKYKMGEDEVPMTNAMQYYMDMSNAFLELIEGLKKLDLPVVMQRSEQVCVCKGTGYYIDIDGKQQICNRH